MIFDIVCAMKHNIARIHPLKIVAQRPILFLVLFGLFLYLLNLPSSYTNDQINELFDPVTSKYGIKIVYKVGDDFFSNLPNPPIPAGPDRHSKVTPISHRVLARYPQILAKAFGKYPVHVIKDCLRAINFAGSIDQGGLKYGGSYDPFRRILYIVDNGYRNEDRSVYVVHHELSSLLLYSKSFFINPWTDINPPNFSYSYDTSDDGLKTYNNASSVGTVSDYEKGFMDSYGQTNFENDFNEYSAMIFTYPGKFKKIMDQYPRVRAKFRVWLDFYHKIDPIFTEAYLLGN
jgi:Putative zinc-binding metallo-peptidase